ncbi:MAG: hypothetical protein C4533_01575 [Candidatus Omnitrophota bacterium]|jgi:hypothetical protein|nr:MAG: hypothetical protein C4533_01575 [Candidatus Omnitrophota bacterium]
MYTIIKKILAKIVNNKDLIVTIVAVVALVVSVRGCCVSTDAYRLSKESKNIAKDALDTGKYQFIQINRPYVLISPKKFNDGSFWKIQQKSNHVEIIVKYEIKNVGNVAAKNIELPDNLIIGQETKLKRDAPVSYKKMSEVTLGPGDFYELVCSFVLDYSDEEAAKNNYEYIVSDSSEGLTLLLAVTYTNEIDGFMEYRTIVENRIHNDNALIIKSEMLNLNTKAKN